MSTPAGGLVFADTFSHPPAAGAGAGAIRVDEILLHSACVIREVVVVDSAAAIAIPNQPTFHGMSAPASFSLEFWALALPASGGDAKSAEPAAARYVRLTDKFQYRYAPNTPCRVVLSASAHVPTTHLVVRGTYDSLSLALYGNPAPAGSSTSVPVAAAAATVKPERAAAASAATPIALPALSTLKSETTSLFAPALLQRILFQPHTDASYDLLSFLRARVIPAAGGDASDASTAAGWDAAVAAVVSLFSGSATLPSCAVLATALQAIAPLIAAAKDEHFNEHKETSTTILMDGLCRVLSVRRNLAEVRLCLNVLDSLLVHPTAARSFARCGGLSGLVSLMDAAYWRERSPESMLTPLPARATKTKSADAAAMTDADASDEKLPASSATAAAGADEVDGEAWIGSQCASRAAHVLLRAVEHPASMHVFVTPSPAAAASAADADTKLSAAKEESSPYRALLRLLSHRDRSVCSRLLSASQQVLERVAIWEAIQHARQLTQHFVQHATAANADSKSAAPAVAATGFVVPAPILAALQSVAAVLYRVSRSTYIADDPAASGSGSAAGHSAPPRHSRKALASALSPEWASFTSAGGWGFDAGIGTGSSAASSVSTSVSVSDVELGSEWRTPNLPVWSARFLHAHRIVHVIVALLNHSASAAAARAKSEQKSSPAADDARTNARMAVFTAVRPLLLLLASSVNGLAYLSCDSGALKSLFSSLWAAPAPAAAAAAAGSASSSASAAAATAATDAPAVSGSNELEISLVPDVWEPTLSSCFQQPALCTGRVLCGTIVRQLRALVLVRAFLADAPLQADPTSDINIPERVLATLHCLHVMTATPVSTLSVSWALNELGAFAAPAFRQLIASSLPALISPYADKPNANPNASPTASPQSNGAKLHKPAAKLDPFSQYGVSLLLSTVESDSVDVALRAALSVNVAVEAVAAKLEDDKSALPAASASSGSSSAAAMSDKAADGKELGLVATGSASILTLLKSLKHLKANASFKLQLLQTIYRLRPLSTLKKKGAGGLCALLSRLSDTTDDAAQPQQQTPAGGGPPITVDAFGEPIGKSGAGSIAGLTSSMGLGYGYAVPTACGLISCVSLLLPLLAHPRAFGHRDATPAALLKFLYAPAAATAASGDDKSKSVASGEGKKASDGVFGSTEGFGSGVSGVGSAASAVRVQTQSVVFSHLLSHNLLSTLIHIIHTVCSFFDAHVQKRELERTAICVLHIQLLQRSLAVLTAILKRLSELDADEAADGNESGDDTETGKAGNANKRRRKNQKRRAAAAGSSAGGKTKFGGVEFTHSAVAHAVVRVHATIAKHSHHFKYFFPGPAGLFSPAGSSVTRARVESDTVRSLRSALYQSMWIMMARGWWPLLPQLTHCIFSQPAMLYGSLCVLNGLLPAPLPVSCALPSARGSGGALPYNVLRVRDWWNTELTGMLARAPVVSAVTAPTPIPDPNTTDSTIVSALTLLADVPLAPQMATGVSLQDGAANVGPGAAPSASAGNAAAVRSSRSSRARSKRRHEYDAQHSDRSDSSSDDGDDDDDDESEGNDGSGRWLRVWSKDVPATALKALPVLTKSSSPHIHTALLTTFTRLSDVSPGVGKVLLERLLDLARAQIIRVCWWLENGGNPHHQHTADLCLLLRLMRMLTALSERTAAHWILNDAGLAGAMLPLLALPLPPFSPAPASTAHADEKTRFEAISALEKARFAAYGTLQRSALDVIRAAVQLPTPNPPAATSPAAASTSTPSGPMSIRTQNDVADWTVRNSDLRNLISTVLRNMSQHLHSHRSLTSSVEVEWSVIVMSLRVLLTVARYPAGAYALLDALTSFNARGSATSTDSERDARDRDRSRRSVFDTANPPREEENVLSVLFARISYHLPQQHVSFASKDEVVGPLYALAHACTLLSGLAQPPVIQKQSSSAASDAYGGRSRSPSPDAATAHVSAVANYSWVNTLRRVVRFAANDTKSDAKSEMKLNPANVHHPLNVLSVRLAYDTAITNQLSSLMQSLTAFPTAPVSASAAAPAAAAASGASAAAAAAASPFDERAEWSEWDRRVRLRRAVPLRDRYRQRRRAVAAAGVASRSSGGNAVSTAWNWSEQTEDSLSGEVGGTPSAGAVAPVMGTIGWSLYALSWLLRAQNQSEMDANSPPFAEYAAPNPLLQGLLNTLSQPRAAAAVVAAAQHQSEMQHMPPPPPMQPTHHHMQQPQQTIVIHPQSMGHYQPQQQPGGQYMQQPPQQPNGGGMPPGSNGPGPLVSGPTPVAMLGQARQPRQDNFRTRNKVTGRAPSRHVDDFAAPAAGTDINAAAAAAAGMGSPLVPSQPPQQPQHAQPPLPPQHPHQMPLGGPPPHHMQHSPPASSYGGGGGPYGQQPPPHHHGGGGGGYGGGYGGGGYDDHRGGGGGYGNQPPPSHMQYHQPPPHAQGGPYPPPHHQQQQPRGPPPPGPYHPQQPPQQPSPYDNRDRSYDNRR